MLDLLSFSKKSIYSTFLALAILFILPANAELRIDITQGSVNPMPIAVADLNGKSAKEQQFGRDISRVISNNLERSGLFKAIDRKSFIQTNDALQSLPRFGDWRIINAQALLQGRTELIADGRLRVDLRLWDVFAESEMIGVRYLTIPENWRRIAHMISDAIYERITGESGYFDSRIVYIAESGPADRRKKRLALMDQDGANHRFLTDGSSLVLTPRFSPEQQEITYLSYYGNLPRVYIFNIDTGREEILGDFPGMTFAPRFSPDGKKVIISMAKGGNSDIYTMDIRTRKLLQLTFHSAIDTSASFSQDGAKIAFNSDRGGTQQIYVMNKFGKKIRRISYGKGRYATPVWSPRGDLIAFTKMHKGRFFIGVMRPDGSGERLLDENFLVESPTWSPNGRVLMFFRQSKSTVDGKGGRSRLYSIDLTGHNLREIITPLDASDPAWSPLIP
jgi:TolB protein